MGCAGCLLSEMELAEQKKAVYLKAKEDAIKSQKIMVLYVLADNSISYMEISAARSNHITPIQYISHLPEATNG